MRYKAIILFFMMFTLSACGITQWKNDIEIKKSSYSEKTVDARGKFNFDISCDMANISIYTWKRDEIKFEMATKLNGKFKKELTDKKPGNFDIDIKTDDNTVFLKSIYKRGNSDNINAVAEYTIYMPKSIDNMNFKVDNGKIKLLDDFRGTLNAELDNTDIEINRFDGVLNISGDKGNVKISGGKISGSSKVVKKEGNISIKSEFDLNGEYELYTSLGHIDLLIPADTKIDFETVGELTKNEFKKNVHEVTLERKGFEQSYGKYDGKPPKVRVKSDLGKISIGKY
ncbi:hypothetical protein [Acetivibrio clariflavus]|uniref:Adhesin domain-containing protein n=1 Tax=Acetivibrio clariflavus (strain DSM 19732 / NBRC 101661 / EBR45) TaxID=720554 RepID=G8LVE4_ACECE|nr:hypothetical protein [Acetivibrio clariflavus]AEV68533.1 hypothetical protein Clocl_1931 [Acetivibrio clariflavus DSM 19732]